MDAKKKDATLNEEELELPPGLDITIPTGNAGAKNETLLVQKGESSSIVEPSLTNAAKPSGTTAVGTTKSKDLKPVENLFASLDSETNSKFTPPQANGTHQSSPSAQTTRQYISSRKRKHDTESRDAEQMRASIKIAQSNVFNSSSENSEQSSDDETSASSSSDAHTTNAKRPERTMASNGAVIFMYVANMNDFFGAGKQQQLLGGMMHLSKQNSLQMVFLPVHFDYIAADIASKIGVPVMTSLLLNNKFAELLDKVITMKCLIPDITCTADGYSIAFVDMATMKSLKRFNDKSKRRIYQNLFDGEMIFAIPEKVDAKIEPKWMHNLLSIQLTSMGNEYVMQMQVEADKKQKKKDSSSLSKSKNHKSKELKHRESSHKDKKKHGSSVSSKKHGDASKQDGGVSKQRKYDEERSRRDDEKRSRREGREKRSSGDKHGSEKREHAKKERRSEKHKRTRKESGNDDDDDDDDELPGNIFEEPWSSALGMPDDEDISSLSKTPESSGASDTSFVSSSKTSSSSNGESGGSSDSSSSHKRRKRQSSKNNKDSKTRNRSSRDSKHVSTKEKRADTSMPFNKPRVPTFSDALRAKQQRSSKSSAGPQKPLKHTTASKPSHTKKHNAPPNKKHR